MEFFEKVEAQSSKRICDLEMIEKSLREQLASYESSNDTQNAYQTLQVKLSAAERENCKLMDRISELEENEEILRDNWRRVADEDANRALCLEEKVRMLDVLNRDLKTKLAEMQDFVVINSRPPEGSIADELSASSKRNKLKFARHGSIPLSGGSDDDGSEDDRSNRRIQELKRQVSSIEEEKNSKIANLQERLAQMRENEIKLSETLAEMEMTERELRAKLALYESSEVSKNFF